MACEVPGPIHATAGAWSAEEARRRIGLTDAEIKGKALAEKYCRKAEINKKHSKKNNS